ncbi:hypothetical protein ACLOJK_034571 [Asimina triloba]
MNASNGRIRAALTGSRRVERTTTGGAGSTHWQQVAESSSFAPDAGDERMALQGRSGNGTPKPIEQGSRQFPP